MRVVEYQNVSHINKIKSTTICIITLNGDFSRHNMKMRLLQNKHTHSAIRHTSWDQTIMKTLETLLTNFVNPVNSHYHWQRSHTKTRKMMSTALCVLLPNWTQLHASICAKTTWVFVVRVIAIVTLINNQCVLPSTANKSKPEYSNACFLLPAYYVDE